jgi:hypothetical protein
MKNLFLLLSLISVTGVCQRSKTINGYVRDGVTGKPLADANIFMKSENTGTTSDPNGFFELLVSTDSCRLLISFVGYSAKQITLAPPMDVPIHVELYPEDKLLAEVEVMGTRELRLGNGQVRQLDKQTVQNTAMLLSIPDVMKSLQIFPGVLPGNEGFAAVNVRGGSMDQNLILLEEIPVYNFSHLAGFLSSFDSQIVDETSIVMSGIPARYGERLSSVIDCRIRQGNAQQLAGSWAISPLVGQFTLEGPVKKNKSSFLVSGRRSWLDAVLNAISTDNPLKLNFSDFYFRWDYSLHAANKIDMGFFSVSDRLYSERSFGESAYQVSWGNSAASVRWRASLSKKLTATYQVYISNFNFRQRFEFSDAGATEIQSVRSSITDNTLKANFDYAHRPNQRLRFGLHASFLEFRPEIREFRLQNNAADRDLPAAPGYAGSTVSTFAENELRFNKKVSANFGIRNSLYLVTGRSYNIVQPRGLLVLRYQKNSTLKLSFDHLSQFVHLLTNSSISLPVDLWVPSTQLTRPAVCRQIAVGSFHKSDDDKFEWSVSAYHKLMKNLIEYRDGANFVSSFDNWEDKIVYGRGRAYGIEVMAKKNRGRLTGSVAYTLSKSERTFADINDGHPFPFKYDRRHNVFLNSNWAISKLKNLSLIFVLANGSWLTLPEGFQQGILPPNYQFTSRYLNGNAPNDFSPLELISNRNNFQMPLYHRLDINYTTTKKTKRDNLRSWIFSIYNLYNRQNPFVIFEQQGKIKQTTLFPIIPSISYKLEF